MVQISTVSGGRLSSVESSIASASRLAEAVKGTSSSGGGFTGGDGPDIERDRQHLAASGRFVAEGKARAAANANAAEGSSLLQIADDALESIAAKLDRLAELAVAAEQSGLSLADRARMDVEFQTVKDDIDAIAADTSFNKIKLLQGGVGAGGEFEVSFKVGTGNEAHDDITVSIAPASVSDLSAGLEAGSITSMVGATTARTNIAAASDVLDVIRGGIAGDMERFSIASRNNTVIGRELEETRDALRTPAVVIDLAQVVARRAAEDGGYELEDRTVDQLRRLLIKLADQDYASSAATKPDSDLPADPVAGASGIEPPPTVSTNQPDTTDEDAA
jgi:flagellin